MSRLFDDASSQVLSVDTAAFTAYPFTMCCWFYSDTATVSQVLMMIGDKDTDNVNRWALQAMGAVAGDPIRFASLASSVASNADTSSGYSANTWHHACAVGSSSTNRTVYIDGGSSGTNVTSSTPALSDRTAIGAAYDSAPTAYMSGMIAHAAIWNAALTAAEVASLSRGILPTSIRPASLIHYWPLWGNTDPEPDIVGGLGLALVNAPTKDVMPRMHRRIMRQSRFTQAVAVGGNRRRRVLIGAGS